MAKIILVTLSRVDNIVGKGKNAGYQQFFHSNDFFQQFFQKVNKTWGFSC